MSNYKQIALSVLCLSYLMACGDTEPSPQGGGGSGGGGNNCGPANCPFNYATFKGDTPTVSFRNDLLKDGTGLFRGSCSFTTTCHGDPTRSKASLYLAPALNAVITEDQITQIHTNLVGAPSKTAPTVMRVVAGNPANSFLMTKIDGCFDTSVCTDKQAGASQESGLCGDVMPQGSDALCAADRDLVRRWIAQGAILD